MSRITIAVKTTEGCLWILPQIAEARCRDLEVTVITPGGQGRLVRAVADLAKADSGVTHCPAPVNFSLRRPIRTIHGLWQLLRTVRRVAPDAVLYHLYATALALRLATAGLPIRRVYMVAGPLYLDSRVVRFMERFLARLDNLIICGSEYIYDRYLALGLPKARLTTIPYGVDTERFTPSTEMDRRRSRLDLGLEADAFVVVMVAFVYAPKPLVHRGEEIKGHRHLLQAWSPFSERHPEVALLLVGGGFDAAGEAYRQHLIAEASHGKRTLEHQASWLSSPEDVRQAYHAADVSVSPSLSENHGAALEASSTATPVIVSDTGALPEAVVKGSGWIFHAGSVSQLVDALKCAYDEWRTGSLRDRGRRARQLMIDEFNLHELAGRVVDSL